MLSDVNIEPVHLSTLKNKYLNETRKVPNYINDILTVQNSFTDVVSAKDNFDRKFLGFEAVLHKITSAPTDAICNYWSNITVNEVLLIFLQRS